jgi:hypothetical protein
MNDMASIRKMRPWTAPERVRDLDGAAPPSSLGVAGSFGEDVFFGGNRLSLSGENVAPGRQRYKCKMPSASPAYDMEFSALDPLSAEC